MACNRQPCPAAWVAASWGRCDDTCAQTREVTCRQQLAGGVSEEIRRGGSRGDFIAVVSRAAADSRLADTFERHWRRLAGSAGGTGSTVEV